MWRHLIQHNFWLKLGALALATVTWLAIQQHIVRTQGRVVVRVYRNIPVMVLTEADNAQVFEVVPARVSVTVRGPASVISQLTEADFQAFVNLASNESADEMLKRVEVISFRGLDILKIDPLRIRIKRLNPSQKS